MSSPAFGPSSSRKTPDIISETPPTVTCAVPVRERTVSLKAPESASDPPNCMVSPKSQAKAVLVAALINLPPFVVLLPENSQSVVPVPGWPVIVRNNAPLADATVRSIVVKIKPMRWRAVMRRRRVYFWPCVSISFRSGAKS